ncbi:hypothetical protein M0802_009769 [Mischocyttarus mexicanus]|nr:hypothetical protein M0802_009769 [Mischocyttarus mexicanus]
MWLTIVDAYRTAVGISHVLWRGRSGGCNGGDGGDDGGGSSDREEGDYLRASFLHVQEAITLFPNGVPNFYLSSSENSWPDSQADAIHEFLIPLPLPLPPSSSPLPSPSLPRSASSK